MIRTKPNSMLSAVMTRTEDREIRSLRTRESPGFQSGRVIAICGMPLDVNRKWKDVVGLWPSSFFFHVHKLLGIIEYNVLFAWGCVIDACTGQTVQGFVWAFGSSAESRETDKSQTRSSNPSLITERMINSAKTQETTKISWNWSDIPLPSDAGTAIQFFHANSPAILKSRK